MKMMFVFLAFTLFSYGEAQVSVVFDPAPASPFQPVFDHYFHVKDALVQTDAATAAIRAAELLTSLNTLKQDRMSAKEQPVWASVEKDLKSDAEKISKSKNIERQRTDFISLSNNMYLLMQVASPDNPVYYQFCPMANGGKGAHWLSRENVIRNPYYGSKMMSCGRVEETIRKP